MKKVIAAVHGDREFELALESEVEIIFDLSPNIMSLEGKVKKAHSKNKKMFIHIDLAEGIGKDKFGILHAKEMGIDGVISTRTSLIKAAKEAEVSTIQRFFMVDSQSIDTTLKTINISKPDMIEVMPGTVNKIISRLKEQISMSIIAGGLIETDEEIDDAVNRGAVAISTGNCSLWK